MQNHDSAAATCTSFALFVRLVREITADAPRGNGLRWQRDVLVALLLASKDFLVMIFEMTYVELFMCVDKQEWSHPACTSGRSDAEGHEVAS